MLLLLGEGCTVARGENNLAGAAISTWEALGELVGELLGLRSGHGESVTEFAVERSVGTGHTRDDKRPDGDNGPCSASGGFTDTVEPCCHEILLES